MVFVGVYRAVYDYRPQSDEELEIKDGDLLFVLEKSTEDDWWKCKKKAVTDDEDEPEGLVPSNYLEQARPLHKAKALYDYTQQTDEELSFKEDTSLDVYDESDPDWTLVGKDGEFGFAPAIYIESASASTTTASVPTTIHTPLPPRELAPPPMPTRPQGVDAPIPGEADYPETTGRLVLPSEPARSNPAAALAGIMGHQANTTGSNEYTQRSLAAPPPVQNYRSAPEENEEEPPPKPRRPESQTLPAQPAVQHSAPLFTEPPGVLPSPPYNRAGASPHQADRDIRSTGGGFRLYNIHEMVSHMGKNKKMPTTLGIDSSRGLITISPEKSRDGPSNEWTAEKLVHYSIEGKHVFVELVRPSRSVDFHAGARDTASEIVSALGDLAGAVRAEGLKEVIAASNGTQAAGLKTGKMLYEFMAQGDDEVTVAEGDEVVVLDDAASEEWWKVRRLKNGKEGVVPSSYVEVTGVTPGQPEVVTGLASAKSMAEANRLEEQRLAMEAVKRERPRNGNGIPERSSSLSRDIDRRGTQRSSDDKKPKESAKSKPHASKVRTWTDRSGTFRVEAEYIGLRDGKIHLHKLNGVKIAVPVAKMAVEDLEYVERVTGASLDEDKPLSDIKRRSTLMLKESQRLNGIGVAGASIEPPPQHDWFDFFLQCGVNPQICERYAAAFARDQMSPEVLPEVNEKLLRTLGLKEGDILRVVKYLDVKYDRKKSSGGVSPSPQDDAAATGLFSGPGGALKNNTRKGRPAPAVQTNDVIDDAAFKTKSESPKPKSPGPEAGDASRDRTSAKGSASGFEDDAWDVKPTRVPAATASETSRTEVKPPAPSKLINDDIASLALTSPPLQPTIAPAAAPVAPAAPPVSEPAPPAAGPTQPQGADQAIFEKIAALAPQGPRQRPQAPMITQPTGGLVPPPPRAASAPGFNPQQASSLSIGPLQPQLTGYLPQLAPPGQSLVEIQRLQQLQAQQASYQQGFAAGLQRPGILVPAPTGLQLVQQNYPALQPQPTAFQAPQGLAPVGFMQPQPTGFIQPQQTAFQQPAMNGFSQPTFIPGMQTGSPFSDPPRAPFQPTPSNLSSPMNINTGGFQPSFNISQPTGMNGGYGAQPTGMNPPQLPPQQMGGVFGPSQPIAPLIPQKTGPAPAIRFGVTPGAKPLVAQPTGRANLAKATPQNPFGF